MCGGRSFGATNEMVACAPGREVRGLWNDVGGGGRGGRERGESGHRRSPSHRPSSRAMTIRCTSFVPSPISRIFWSRYRREIGNSSMKP